MGFGRGDNILPRDSARRLRLGVRQAGGRSPVHRLTSGFAVPWSSHSFYAYVMAAAMKVSSQADYPPSYALKKSASTVATSSIRFRMEQLVKSPKSPASQPTSFDPREAIFQ